MSPEEQLRLAGGVLLALVLGGMIGWERETEGRAAGVRTFAAVALGACVCATLSNYLPSQSNPHVIAAGVLTGIGFIGGGVIIENRGNVVGLTTAATLWATGAIGLAIGYRLYVFGITVALITLGLLMLQRIPGWERLTAGSRPDDDTAKPVAVDVDAP